MGLITNIVKTKLVTDGYLPDYPYHLIADDEMCDAFLSHDRTGSFFDNYPCLDESLVEVHERLQQHIRSILDKFCLPKNDPNKIEALPDWILSYMLGTTLSVNSGKDDLHDLLVSLNCDNIDDTFTARASQLCLGVSQSWLRKIPRDSGDYRPPTMFGEPHVLKALRLYRY